MPALVTPESVGLYRVVLSHAFAGSVQRNVFHVHDSTGSTSDRAASDLAAFFRDWWITPDGSHPTPNTWQASAATFIKAKISYFPAGGKLRALLLALDALDLTGRDGADPLPGNATVAIEFFTAYGGRQGHGRMYYPFMTSSALDPANVNRLRAEIVGGMRATFDFLPQLVAVLNPGGHPCELCVFHREGFTPPGGLLTYSSAILGARFSDLDVDSQRGRLPHHVFH